jgi:Hypothetical glycosyl hydrolase family 15/IPT/TIG domain
MMPTIGRTQTLIIQAHGLISPVEVRAEGGTGTAREDNCAISPGTVTATLTPSNRSVWVPRGQRHSPLHGAAVPSFAGSTTSQAGGVMVRQGRGVLTMVLVSAALALVPLVAGRVDAAASVGGPSLPQTGRMLQLFGPTYMSKTTAAYSQADAVTIAENYDLVAASVKQFTSTTLAAMRAANPNVRVLIYLNGSFDVHKTQAYPLTEYARDANGNYIKSRQFGNWLMNISDPSWVSQVSGQCTTLLAQAPYDGCFVDMLGDADLGAGYLTSQPINPATGSVWTQEQELTAATAIAQRVTADHPNDIIMANGLLNGASYFSPTAPTSQLFGGASTALAESWLRAATNAVTSHETPAIWQQEVNMLTNPGGTGDAAAVTTKVWVTATAAQLTAWHRFALASFLLGTTGNTYFSFTGSQSPTEFQTDAANPLDHTQLGAALGPYAALGKAFGRQYADADVIVNPTTKAVTVAIPAPCLTLDGVLATTSLVMPADSGQICSYIPVPVVSGVSPSAGPGAGGTSVTITGSGFSSATAVDFGAANPASFSVLSDTEIDATSPSGSGTVDVTVISPGGTSSTGLTDQFTYQ